MAASIVVTETGTGTGMKQIGTAPGTTTTATEERAEAGTAHVMAVTGKAGCQKTVPHTPLHSRRRPTSFGCAACCRDHRSSGRDARSSQGTPTKPAGSGPPAAGPPAAAGTKPPAAVGRGLLGSK